MRKRLLVSGLFVLMLVIFGCAAPVSDTIPEQTPDSLQEQASEVAREQIPEVQEQKSDSFTNKTVPEEVIGEEGSFEDTRCSRTFSPKFSTGPYYNGPLFDAHFHMPNLIDPSTVEGHGDVSSKGHSSDPVLDESILDQILCNFDKENVIGVIGFVIGDQIVMEETLDAAKSIKEKAPEKINLFLMPAGFDPDVLEIIQQSNSKLFKGYGEMAFYHPSYADILPDSPEVMNKYEVAGKNNLIIMMHPDGRQQTQVENAIRKNPNVKFLIHGPETENYITDILNKYQNAYYSLDAILIRLNSPGALLYTVSGKEEFKSQFGQNYDVMMNDAVAKWKSKIESYPDKFMWGTDRADLWTYDEEVSLMIEEFSRDFIEKLDPTVQEKFAYKNAEELIKR